MKNVALLFPGQGSQTIGMGKDFYENFHESRLVFEEASDATHLNLKKICFEGPSETLTLTENLQPALFTVEIAILKAVEANAELKPLVCAGHSLGEYSALAAVKSISVSDGARLTRLRGQAMQRAVPVGQGTMAAVLGLDSFKVDLLCQKAKTNTSVEVVEPANYNAPGQVVIAGTVAGVQTALSLLKEDPDFKGGKAVPLQVSAPFHCSLMKPAQQELEKPIMETDFKVPTSAVIPNSTAIPVRTETGFVGSLIDQIVMAVQWEQSMKKLRELEVETAIEIGPGKVLSGLLKRIDPEMAARAKNISGINQFKEVLNV